jgi:hypothetical protein
LTDKKPHTHVVGRQIVGRSPLITRSTGSAQMANEIPFGFILFYDPYDYSQACTFCSDFDIDVLEIFINGFCCLTFFSSPEFHACRAFCVFSDFQVEKFSKL